MKLKNILEGRNKGGIIDMLKGMKGDDLMDLATAMNDPQVQKRANIRSRDGESISAKELGMMRKQGSDDRNDRNDRDAREPRGPRGPENNRRDPNRR